MRIWRLLMLNGQLEQKQVGGGLWQAGWAGARAALPSTHSPPLMSIPITLNSFQVADLAMVTKEEAREKLYAMLKAG